uniref:Uncharacterized protein n=1 Tax=Spironucleus salmonicida TaxID=348837 RepID=V6LHA8_9EUKA|eukprot:EST43950.1 hypothetical protein SS50377_16253 [Spironucleus salmonicida]
MSKTAESIMSRLQQITNSQLVQNYKPMLLIDISPVHTTTTSEFIIHYQDNKLYVRALQRSLATKQIQSSQALVQTPLATKDFIIEFHTPIVDQCKIQAVHFARQTKQEAFYVTISNGVDNQLFRIPLKYFQFQVSKDNQIQNFQFALRPNELPQMTRFIDQFKDMSVICPISFDYLVGFDRKTQSICVFNYSEIHQPIQKFKHTSVQHSRMLEPQKICIDGRGAIFSKTSGILQSVQPNKSGVLLVYDRYAGIDIWEYFMPGKQQNFLNLRELSPNLGQIKSRYSYLKNLFPLQFVPEQLKLGQDVLFSQFQPIQFKSSKSGDEHFLFIYSISFNPVLNESFINIPEKQMDSSLISSLPTSVFTENNVFLFSTKKFMAAAKVDYRPDIITLSQCNRYAFVGSTESNLLTVFRIEQEKNGFSLAHSKVIVHPNAGAKMTSILSSPNWLVMLDAEDQVYTYNEDTSQNTAPVSIYCGENFGTLHLPKIDKIQDRKVNQSLSIKEMDKSMNKSVHFDTNDVSKRKIQTRIPNIENFMQNSLFSPKAESASRVLTSIVNKSQTFETLSKSMKPIDVMLSNVQIREVQDKFKLYFNHYKIMRTIDEYILLCININIPDEEISHLDEELVNFMRVNVDNIRISQQGANFDLGSVEFLYNEISFINPKLIQLFGSVRDEFNLDFSQIDSIRLFFSTKSTETRFLSQMHHLLDTQINFLEISEAKICEVLEIELQDEVNKNMSLMDLLSVKIDQMVDYFQKCCLYQVGGLSALMQAIKPTNPNSMQSMTSQNKSDTSSSLDSFSSKNLGQMLQNLQEESEKQFKVFDDIEQKLLSNQIDLSGLPIIESVRTDNSRIDITKNNSIIDTQRIMDHTNISNYQPIQTVSDPVISSQHQKLIKDETHDGEQVQDISQHVEIFEDNDPNNKVDQYEFIEFHVRGDNDDEDGEYVTEDIIEEEIIEYYDTDTEKENSVDLELNENQKKRVPIDLNLPQRPPKQPLKESLKQEDLNLHEPQVDIQSPILQAQQQDSIQFIDDSPLAINYKDIILPVMIRIQKQNPKYANIQLIKSKFDQEKIVQDLIKRISENFVVKKNKISQQIINKIVFEELGLTKVPKSPSRKDSSQLVQDMKSPDISGINDDSKSSKKNVLKSPSMQQVQSKVNQHQPEIPSIQNNIQKDIINNQISEDILQKQQQENMQEQTGNQNLVTVEQLSKPQITLEQKQLETTTIYSGQLQSLEQDAQLKQKLQDELYELECEVSGIKNTVSSLDQSDIVMTVNSQKDINTAASDTNGKNQNGQTATTSDASGKNQNGQTATTSDASGKNQNGQTATTSDASGKNQNGQTATTSDASGKNQNGQTATTSDASGKNQNGQTATTSDASEKNLAEIASNNIAKKSFLSKLLGKVAKSDTVANLNIREDKLEEQGDNNTLSDDKILNELVSRPDSLEFSSYKDTQQNLQQDVESFNNLNGIVYNKHNEEMNQQQKLVSPNKNYTGITDKQKLNDQLLSEIMLRSQQSKLQDDSLTSMMLSQQAVELMTGEIEQVQLYRDAQSKDTLKDMIEQLGILQGYGNKFFETQLIQNRRQSTFRQDLLGIRQGKLPKNDLMSSFYSTVGTKGIGSALKVSAARRSGMK